ncbi:hypothetical protein [Limnochorda pilosa]|nr:hypothetical protein [Limnochorda pilosa]
MVLLLFWEKLGMDQVLQDLTPAQRQSTLAMVLQRIVDPGSKLSLKERLANTVIARPFSATRLDEDKLYDSWTSCTSTSMESRAACACAGRQLRRSASTT